MLWVSHLDKASFFRLDWGRRNPYIVVWVFTGLSVFFESASLMNEGDPKNREHWVQIITTTPEISSTDYSRNQTTDKRIISSDSAYKYGLMLKTFRPLWLEKILRLSQHIIDQWNKYGENHDMVRSLTWIAGWWLSAIFSFYFRKADE